MSYIELQPLLITYCWHFRNCCCCFHRNDCPQDVTATDSK